MATKPNLRTIQRATVRRVTSGAGGGTKPAESGGTPKVPGWQIGVGVGVAVAVLYAFLIAKPEAVAKSAIPTTQTKNRKQSQGN
ncbi:hypothetical protein LEL_10742 [Akanthomyces lecanii RCEF 1005]|uniref:Uncharacterized protein n=1 Tax=Akanthomyces lecanii RCEF 1005 TaxID=1081108 RepID=A0A167UZZ3_CORDF|nr:hypothetical protein LEL_10742 [Akanthomyces lecanii RCEF 1005]